MTAELTKTAPKSTQHAVPSAERTRAGAAYTPRIDIWENESELILCADMPGVTADELEIQFEQRELRIYGKVAPRYQHLQLLDREYGIGDFFRSFAIGESIDASRISAELKQGVLTLHLPKTEKVKPRKIKVVCS
jgi:HSP20 family protein